MRVGLDIDNVITNFDKTILKEFIKEDKNKRNTGIVDSNAKHITEGMFDWSKEEVQEFFCNNMEKLAEKLEPRDGAKYYIDKMLNDGHEIYLISHRAYPHYNQPFEITQNWLKDNNINYTKLILSKSTDKSPECIENKIDIMFDDVLSNCIKMKKSSINCYLMRTNYNMAEKSNIDFVLNWNDLYKTVCKIAVQKLDKVHVILDTDTNNEADDQFALAYALKSDDRLILDAVTIAPYYHENGISITEGIQESLRVCEDIFNLCGKKDNIICKGSSDYFKNGYLEENDAVKKMIDVINKNELTYILAIGALTNVAVLLKLHPEVYLKIKVIWLGGNDLLINDNREYNFKQDIEAVRYVYNSGVDLTVIPCKNVASTLVTSIYELKNYFNINVGIGKYLYDRFYNDKNHGITTRRVIWDISVVAYVINPYWFKVKHESVPIIKDDLLYESNNNTNKIKFVTELNANEIYEDVFNKLSK